MRVLQIHNLYRQPGGEDQVVAAEAALLESRGHEVLRYTRHNDEIGEGSGPGLAASTFWNRTSYRDVAGMVERKRPDIVHCHNLQPLVSPSVYYAAHRRGVPVVQTLHNYRLVCPGALLFREGKVCEDCLGKAIPWPGVVHACYRGSRAATGAVASALTVHRMFRTWSRTVSMFIALTDFARDKLVQGGLPRSRIRVKPNFIYPDPGMGPRTGGYAVFAGRLTPEKGVGALLAAWRRLPHPTPLTVLGDGPMKGDVMAAAGEDPRIVYRGQVNREEALRILRSATLLIFPSEWYEGFPMILVEALAMGLPSVFTNTGSAASILEDGRTGCCFRAGDAGHLAERVGWCLEHPEALQDMSRCARAVYEQRYSADINYRQIMALYQQARSMGGDPEDDTRSAA